MIRVGAIGVLFAVIGTSALAAADFSSYRGLQFGMDLTAAVKQTGRNPHKRNWFTSGRP